MTDYRMRQGDYLAWLFRRAEVEQANDRMRDHALRLALTTPAQCHPQHAGRDCTGDQIL